MTDGSNIFVGAQPLGGGQWQSDQWTHSAGNTEPSWSSDGTKIAFTSARDGNGELYAKGAFSSSPEIRITNTAANESEPAWSPTGQKLVFSRGGDIWTMNADGTGVVRLPTDPEVETEPAWSPDGSRIAFERGGLDTCVSYPACGDVIVMSAAGADQHAIGSSTCGSLAS